MSTGKSENGLTSFTTPGPLLTDQSVFWGVRYFKDARVFCASVASGPFKLS